MSLWRLSSIHWVVMLLEQLEVLGDFVLDFEGFFQCAALFDTVHAGTEGQRAAPGVLKLTRLHAAERGVAALGLLGGELQGLRGPVAPPAP